MYENKGNRKKNRAFIVLCKNIHEELEWMSKNSVLKFRNLYRYFVDKRWERKLYGAGKQIIKLDEDGDITKELCTHTTGNLGNISKVTSYLPGTARPMKDLNVLIEYNYIVDAVLNNPKDKRLPNYKINDLMSNLLNRYDMLNNPAKNYLGDYEVNTIIPLSAWLTEDDLKVPANLFKPTSPLAIGKILKHICIPANLKRMGKVTIYGGNYLLILDPNNIDQEELKKDSNYIFDILLRFLNKVKTSGTIGEDSDKTEEDIEAEKHFDEAEQASKNELVVEDVLTKASIDPDKASSTVKSAVKNVVSSATDKIAKGETKEVVVTRTKLAPKTTTKETKTPVTKEENKHHLVIKDIESTKDKESDIDSFEEDEETSLEPIDTKETEEVIPDVLDKEDVVVDSDAVNTIISAKLSGQSIQSYQRNEALKKKYTTLNLGDIPLTDIIESQKQYEIPDITPKVNTVNEGMKHIKASNFDKVYNENLATSDLANILLHFSHVKPALYLNKNIIVTDASTPTDRVLRYTVEFESEDRKRHKFSFLLPKMYKDHYLYLNDQEMNLIYQKLPFPITKIATDTCQGVTNYKKIISYRYGSNISPIITRLKKMLTTDNKLKSIKVTSGSGVKLNSAYLTTIEYDELSSVITKLNIGNSNNMTRIFFIIEDAIAVIDTKLAPVIDELPDNDILLPLAINQTGSSTVRYYISGLTNTVYDQSGKAYGELSNFIIECLSAYNPDIKDELKEYSTGTKFVYSVSTILGLDIPMILVLAAADPGGLTAVLEKAKINYKFSEHKENTETVGSIKFEDGYLIFDRYPYENSLLLNGLESVPTREFSFYDMASRDTYVEIFDLMYNRRNVIDGLTNFYYMFIDPITADVLRKLNMPTEFTEFMLYCNGVLADNSFQIDSSYFNSRIRSNEIIYAHLYRFLAEAWGPWKDGRVEKFSIPENCVIKELMTSNIVDPHTTLNMVLETENDRQIKLKGPSGMNEEHSFTLEKRAYHPSMKGIIGMNTTPSGEVGIGRHLTLNPNILDARGFITPYDEVKDKDKDFDGTELTTPGELMQVFGPESSDIERLAMGISQSKHVIPVAKSASSPVSYDMERVIPYLSNDFAFTAKQDGKVISIENDVCIIQYKDGTYDDIDLGKHPVKNTDGGLFIINQLSTDLKVGQKFKEGDLLAYDHKYMNEKDMFGEPLANMGTMARVSVETNGNVYEDACEISDRLGHQMTSKITKMKRIILSPFANIKHLVKVGDKVNTNDVLLSFDDTQDEFSSQILAQMAEESGEDEDEIIATNAPVLSKYTGTIVDITITSTIPTSQMTPSMKKIVEEYNKKVNKREQSIAKYRNIYDANTICKTSEVLKPDSTGKVKGVKVGEGIFIDIYIEYEDIMSIGDKLTFFSALKGIVSHIIPEGYEAYSEDNPERKIDAVVSTIGFYKRMTLDFYKLGAANKILIEKKRILKEKFGQKIKDEIKKKK